MANRLLYCMRATVMESLATENEYGVLRKWFLIYCKPNQEKTAESNLYRQGYNVYLPMMMVRRRRNTRYEIVPAAMFPRYLFIQLCEESDDWTPIRSTVGVANMVRFGKVVAEVPDGLVEDLQLFQKEQKELGDETNAAKLKKGDRVKIIAGVAKDYRGVIISKSSSERVLLLLETAAGYTAKMQLPEAWLEEAE